jgi:hypothetical protein
MKVAAPVFQHRDRLHSSRDRSAAAMTNAPESVLLTREEHEVFETARVAIHTLGRSFDMWMDIARAVLLAHTKAAGLIAPFAFRHILDQQGILQVLGTTWNSQKTTASKLMKILEKLPGVMEWRETLSHWERVNWAAPTTIYKHCPLFDPLFTGEPRPAKPARPSRTELLAEELEGTQRELEEAQAQIRGLEERLKAGTKPVRTEGAGSLREANAILDDENVRLVGEIGKRDARIKELEAQRKELVSAMDTTWKDTLHSLIGSVEYLKTKEGEEEYRGAIAEVRESLVHCFGMDFPARGTVVGNAEDAPCSWCGADADEVVTYPETNNGPVAICGDCLVKCVNEVLEDDPEFLATPEEKAAETTAKALVRVCQHVVDTHSWGGGRFTDSQRAKFHEILAALYKQQTGGDNIDDALED